LIKHHFAMRYEQKTDKIRKNMNNGT